jgi:hypothetical protein
MCAPIGKQMSVLRRMVRLLVGLPIFVVAVAIMVANSQWVRLSLDPFRPDDPALSLELPLYAWLVGALFLGTVAGSLATWMARARWRPSARRGDAGHLAHRRPPEAARQLALR